jgi:hypothetical protein
MQHGSRSGGTTNSSKWVIENQTSVSRVVASYCGTALEDLDYGLGRAQGCSDLLRTAQAWRRLAQPQVKVGLLMPQVSTPGCLYLKTEMEFMSIVV